VPTGQPTRIGFVGAGMVAELHAAAISRSGSACLAGVFDPDAQLAARRSASWSCTPFATFDSMISSDDVDAVFVLSPTERHIEQARAALLAGKHLLVEKPVGRNAAEITQLINLAERQGRVCIPGHNYAYIPEFARIRRLARDGSLGTLRLAAIVFAIAHSEEVAGHYDGVTWLVMPHHAYLMHGMLGMPASVTAGTTTPAWTTLDQEDQGWIVLDYPPHGTAVLLTTLGADDDSADPWTFTVKAIGSEGSASASWRSAIIRRAIGSMHLGWVPYEEAYEHELAAFLAAVAGDSSQIASPMSDAVAVARILNAAELSIRERRTVSLSEIPREQS
jgi:predicted dehydrogenase